MSTVYSGVGDLGLRDVCKQGWHTYTVRACLHGGGGPQVGEVTRLAVVEKWPSFTCKLTTSGPRVDVTRCCCVVDRHLNRESGGRTTHFGGQCSFPLIICSRCNISVLWLLRASLHDPGLLFSPS